MRRTTTLVVAGLALCLGASQVGRANDQYAYDVPTGQILVYHGYVGSPQSNKGGVYFWGGGTVDWMDDSENLDMDGEAVLYETITLNMYAAPAGVPQPGLYEGLEAYGASIANIYGGLPGPLSAYGGTINVYGTGFAIDGSPVGYGSIAAASGDELTGTLAEGTPLDVPIYADGGGVINLLPPAPTALEATVALDPGTLNLGSNGKWITCYIELPAGYDVDDIDVSTVMLDGRVAAAAAPTAIGDYNLNGIPDLMVKFSRSAVAALLSPGQQTLTVTGALTDGTPFAGSATIQVIGKGKK